MFFFCRLFIKEKRDKKMLKTFKNNPKALIAVAVVITVAIMDFAISNNQNRKSPQKRG